MNPLVVSWVFGLLDDMVELGTFFWFKYALGFTLVTVFVGDIIPYIDIIFGVFAVLFTLSAIFTYWWDKRGREKYVERDITEIAEAVKGRDK